MKKKLSKFMSFLLVFGLVLGLCPIPAKKAEAATKSVSLDVLGSHGTTTIGSKKKSGEWYKMTVDGKKAFCMNLGYTCHSGDKYSESSSGTYSTDDGGKKALKAYIGYWFDQTMKQSNKAFIVAQALLWGIEEDKTSESQLKTILTNIKKSTGYYSSKTANQLYKDIFQESGTLSVKYKEYKYSGSSSHRQILLHMKASDKEEPEPHPMNVDSNYRQIIKFTKKDEVGRPVPGAKFTIEAMNIDQLYYYKLNGTGTDVDEEIPDFTIEATTDSNGQFTIRYTYRIQTQTYYFYTDDELANMDSAAKKKAKEEMEEKGQKHSSDMSETKAQDMMEEELADKLNAIKNQYIIKEIDSGNPNIFIDPDLAKGMSVWYDEEYTNFNYNTSEEANLLYKNVEAVNKYKKASVQVNKLVSNTRDKKAHGEVSVDGAMYQLYSDADCTEKAGVYMSDGTPKRADIYVIKNGKLETDYLQAGKTYYLKEIKAPEGFFISNDVLKIQVDGSQLTQEYTANAKTYEVYETEKKGHLEIYKFTTDGSTGPATFEEGATFEVTLKGKKHDECKEDERAILVADKNGYAKTTEPLVYGTYIIHQTKTGSGDTEKIADEEIEIAKDITSEALNNQVYTRLYNNKPFSAYLKVIKKSKNTEKTVLKKNTKYQIYKVDADGKEEKVIQTYSNGNQRVDMGTDEFPFVTDETGVIMTVKPLVSGKYRIYEIDSADGLHITTKYIEFEIGSELNNYTVEKDDEGNSYATVTLEYTNEDTYGKLKIFKSGEMLSEYKHGKFIYEKQFLKGVTFEIYADGDIATQDNQGTNWYEDKELVATVTTGEDAKFTKECPGITGYTLEDDGTVTVNLPLGKYRVKEKKTIYGYVLSDTEWPVEFNWQNKEEEYVLNATDTTDENGVLSVVNERAKAAVSLKKTDNQSSKPISNVRFGIYSKDNIYNAAGEKIVDAGAKLGEMVTNEKGESVCEMDLPLMSESYGKAEEKEEAASGSAVSVETDTSERALNSGDYYLREISVSGSYYLDGTMLPVHLEYGDENTPYIEKEITHTNTQTAVEIDKTEIAGSDEINGCHLQISDEKGNVIASWISGSDEDVVLNEDLGFQNLNTEITETNHRILRGLFQNTTYILTETRPADGYVTADSIAFRLQESVTEAGKTLVSIRNANGEFVLQNENIVHMVDEKTTVSFEKKNKEKKLIGGAEIEVLDSTGKKVAEFTTKKGKTKTFSGVFKVGETYTFKEVQAPDGYDVAKPVTYTIQDTGEEQIVTMTDKKLGIISTKGPKDFSEGSSSKSPKTGYFYLIYLLLAAGVFSAGAGMIAWKKGRRGYAKKEN